MAEYRPDRIVRLLTGLVTFLYFGLLFLTAVVLVAVPAVRLFSSDDSWTWGLNVPASITSVSAVDTRWGPAELEVESARAGLDIPIIALPWWLIGILWTHLATGLALVLLFLYNLRRIFQRVREGLPFDVHNVRRLRVLGMLLIAFAVVDGVADFVMALAVRRGMTSDELTISTGLHIDMRTVFVALVLVSLAEIFRRGADLESEQALVV